MLCTFVFSCALLGAGRGHGQSPAGPPADLLTYESANAKAGQNADDHVRLAIWCEAHGLSAERMKHLALAVASDPAHALARGLLGLVAYQGQWKQPDQVARAVQDDPQIKARIQEYLGRRAKIRERAEDQWKLALWCEQNGLKEQANAHFYQ